MFIKVNNHIINTDDISIVTPGSVDHFTFYVDGQKFTWEQEYKEQLIKYLDIKE